MKEVKIIIGKDGTQRIETSGFQGTTCLETTELILRRLAEKGIPVQIKEDKKKEEFYANPTGIETGLHA